MCGLFLVLFCFVFALGGISPQMLSQSATLLLYLVSCECLLWCNPGRKGSAEEFCAGEGDDPTKLFGAQLKWQNTHVKTLFLSKTENSVIPLLPIITKKENLERQQQRAGNVLGSLDVPYSHWANSARPAKYSAATGWEMTASEMEEDLVRSTILRKNTVLI